jgi:hypothetical protein
MTLSRYFRRPEVAAQLEELRQSPPEPVKSARKRARDRRKQLSPTELRNRPEIGSASPKSPAEAPVSSPLAASVTDTRVTRVDSHRTTIEVQSGSRQPMRIRPLGDVSDHEEYRRWLDRRK